MRVMLYLNCSLCPNVWISFRKTNVLVGFKFEKLYHFFVSFVVIWIMMFDFVFEAKKLCFGFGGKYAPFEDWISTGMSMTIPNHVKWSLPVKIPVKVAGPSSVDVNKAFNEFQFNSAAGETVRKKTYARVYAKQK